MSQTQKIYVCNLGRKNVVFIILEIKARLSLVNNSSRKYAFRTT